MMQFHLNENGDAGPCKAKQGRCPFGLASDHYDSAEEAREAYEASQTMDHLLSNAMRNNPKTRAMQEQIERNEATRRELARRYAANAPEVDTEFGDVDVETLRAYNDTYYNYEETLSEEERRALYDYTGITYDPLNKYLRDPNGFKTKADPETLPKRLGWSAAQMVLLDSALAKAPREQRQLFRRLDQEGTSDIMGSEEWATKLGFVQDGTVTFKAYSSTSVNPGYIARTTQRDAHTSVVLVINTDEGAPAGPTVYDRARTHTQEGEAEIVLPRDRTFKVREVKRSGFTSEGFDRIEVLTVFLDPVEEN